MNLSLGPVYDSVFAWFAAYGLPGWLCALVAIGLVVVLPVIAIVLPIAGTAQYFERKVAAATQRRWGPRNGAEGVALFVVQLVFFFLPRYKQAEICRRILGIWGIRHVMAFVAFLGMGQMAADGVKMFVKEDIIPAGADKFLFKLATPIAVVGAFTAFAVLPFSQNWYMADFPVAAVYVGAVAAFSAVSILLAGWSSNNKWSLIGGIRSVAQIVSYEIPVSLAIASVVMWSGTMSLQGIIAAQYQPGIASFLGWNLFASPFMLILAVVYYMAGLAECNRAPFDLPEAESELVCGFSTEYSGLRWGLFFVAEYSDMFLVGGLFSVLFLGGYQSPIGEQWIVALPPVWEALVHAAILVAKCVASIGFMMWIRWTLPRFRVDQVMRLAWLKLVPLALFCMMGLATSLWLFGRGEASEQIAYGRVLTAPLVHVSASETLATWGIVGGAMAILVVLAKLYGEPKPMPTAVARALTELPTAK